MNTVPVTVMSDWSLTVLSPVMVRSPSIRCNSSSPSTSSAVGVPDITTSPDETQAQGVGISLIDQSCTVHRSNAGVANSTRTCREYIMSPATGSLTADNFAFVQPVSTIRGGDEEITEAFSVHGSVGTGGVVWPCVSEQQQQQQQQPE